VAGCEGYGCEPVFALAYMRHVNDAGRQLTLQYTSPLFERALRNSGLADDEIERIVEQVNQIGTCQDLEDVPEIFARFRGQRRRDRRGARADAGRAPGVHRHAISKTCNFPASATDGRTWPRPTCSAGGWAARG